MSKNAATIAEAISLLSDVLVHDTAWEAETETVNSNEYDDLKEQAIEFGSLMSDDLSTITDDLDRVLDLDDEINGEADDIDMCESCGDAVATSRSRGYKVCSDCYVEMGV